MGSNSVNGSSNRRYYKSSGHKRKNKLKPNDPLPPGTTTKELSCASCRIRKTRCSGDRPACVQCIRGATAKGYPADDVHCVYSAASVFAKKEDVAFEAQVGGRGAKCIWDGTRPPPPPPPSSSSGSSASAVTIGTAAPDSSCATSVEGDQEESARVRSEEPREAIESLEPAHQPISSPTPPLPSPLIVHAARLSDTVTKSTPRSPLPPLPPLSPFPPTPTPSHLILPPPAPQLPPVSTPCPLDLSSRSSISRIFLSPPPPPPPPLDLGRLALSPLAHDGLPITPRLLPNRSPSPASPTTPEEPLPSTADASFWDWGPLTSQEVAHWPGMKYAATQAGLFLTGAFL